MVDDTQHVLTDSISDRESLAGLEVWAADLGETGDTDTWEPKPWTFEECLDYTMREYADLWRVLANS